MLALNAFQKQIEVEIQELFSKLGEPHGLYAPVSYVLSSKGKRIRPALCLAGCALFNRDMTKEAISPAIGLEVFHNFTLLHDDLMDNSDMRRNNQTVHKKWNNNTAILSGDAMMILAYKLVSEAPGNVLKSVLDVFSKTAIEVCEGQQYDMEFELRNDVVEVEYLEMIRLKTAVLLGGSLKIGSIIGNAPENDSQELYDFGCDMGLSFQLQDDWLDVYGNSNDFGKPIGGDIVCNKKTFLLISALNILQGNSRDELMKWLAKEEFDKNEKISAVKNLFDEAEVSKITREKINFYYKNSLKRIGGIKGAVEIKTELEELAHNIIERTR